MAEGTIRFDEATKILYVTAGDTHLGENYLSTYYKFNNWVFYRMNRKKIKCCVILVVCIFLLTIFSGCINKSTHMVEMRDGVKLATDVYLPKYVNNPPHGVLLVRTPYNKDPMGLAAASLYIACLQNNEKKTQKDIAEAAGVTEVTVRNRYKSLKRVLNITLPD